MPDTASIMPSDPRQAGPIEIKHRLRAGDPGHVMIETQGGDRFPVSIDTNVLWCDALTRAEEMRRDAEERSQRFSAVLAEWCRSHPAVVRAVGGSRPRMRDSILIIITEGSRYRFDLDEALAALEITLARDFPEIPLDVVMLPASCGDDLSAYIQSGKAFEVYAKSSGPQASR